MPQQFVRVAQTPELPPGEMTLVELDQERILLVNVGGQFFAVSEVCPHADGPLSEGFLETDVVECSWHGSRFSVRTGEVQGPPAAEGLRTYPVRLEGQDIFVGPAPPCKG